MTDNQTILDNSKANMFDALMAACDYQSKGMLSEALLLKAKWFAQSNLIYLLENNISTPQQKNAAAGELNRLGLTEKKQDRYTETGYWEEQYSQ